MTPWSANRWGARRGRTEHESETLTAARRTHGPTTGRRAVAWRDIAGVRVLVETPLVGRHVEPSQGSHFFRNMVTGRVAYLAVDRDERYDRAALDALPAARELPLVRHVILDAPIYAVVDGRLGHAVVLTR